MNNLDKNQIVQIINFKVIKNNHENEKKFFLVLLA